MKKIFTKKYTIFKLTIFFVSIFLFSPLTTEASVLLPGNISMCGELAVPGTYTLTGNIADNGTTTCFMISSDNVVIEGGGFTITGSAPLAIDGRGISEGQHGYTNLIINDLSFLGYETGINLSGADDLSGNGVNNGYKTRHSQSCGHSNHRLF